MIDPGLRARIRPHVLVEVKNQGVVPDRFTRIRLQLYYRVLHDIRFLWPNVEYTIRDAIRLGDLVLVNHEGARWVHLPGLPPDVVDEQLQIKGPIYKAWMQASGSGGSFGQSTVREAFRLAGWPTSGPTQILLPDGTSIEVDVPAVAGGIPVWTEVKNKFSEVHSAPGNDPSEDQKQIDKLFSAAHKFGVTPILFASLIDRSFFGYQAAFKGLSFAYLFQYLPPEHQPVCEAIRAHFRIGHIKTLPIDPVTVKPIPPTHMINHARAIPSVLRRTYP